MASDFHHRRFRFFPSVLLMLLALLTGCERGDNVSRHGIQFPGDTAIAQALQDNFSQDPNNAPARALIQRLGGAEGRLHYTVHTVVYRQGAFETRYDVHLRMGQAGTDSLRQLYATMVPPDEASKLPEQTLAAHEKWLADKVQSLQRSEPEQATALRNTLDTLARCYREARAGDEVALMTGLAALISPARDGWQAEKLPSPQLQLQCLPL